MNGYGFDPNLDFVPEVRLWLRSRAESMLLLRKAEALRTTVELELLLKVSSVVAES